MTAPRKRVLEIDLRKAVAADQNLGLGAEAPQEWPIVTLSQASASRL